MESIKKFKWSVLLLLLVGHISIVGKLLGIEIIQGLGFISTASPLPLVFSSFRGVEGFASDFFIHYRIENEEKSFQITSEVYDYLKGPYNRRNAFGAAFAGAPMLTAENEKRMVDSVLRYAFCQPQLKSEFKIPLSASDIVLTVVSKTQGSEKSWTFPVGCND